MDKQKMLIDLQSTLKTIWKLKHIIYKLEKQSIVKHNSMISLKKNLFKLI